MSPHMNSPFGKPTGPPDLLGRQRGIAGMVLEYVGSNPIQIFVWEPL